MVGTPTWLTWSMFGVTRGMLCFRKAELRTKVETAGPLNKVERSSAQSGDVVFGERIPGSQLRGMQRGSKFLGAQEIAGGRGPRPAIYCGHYPIETFGVSRRN